MEKKGLYSRPSIMLSKGSRRVDKNFSLGDKEAADQEKKLQGK